MVTAYSPARLFFGRPDGASVIDDMTRAARSARANRALVTELLLNTQGIESKLTVGCVRFAAHS